MKLYPIATRLLTPNPYSRPQKPIEPKGIVIHWTANSSVGADAEANRKFFENRKYGKTGYGSAHYIIDDQEIVLCIPENEMGYHVGARSYKTQHFGSYPNATTIGLEMCMNSDGNFKKVYEQTVLLAAHLIKKYKLDPDKDLVRHYDITGKNCPGYFTSDHWGSVNNNYAVKYGLGSNADQAWQQFKADVKEALMPKEAIEMFKDIMNHWAKGNIEYLAKLGIISGRSDGTFDPNANITRAETATVIARALQYIDKNYTKK